MDRRNLLTAAGLGLGAVALAGCKDDSAPAGEASGAPEQRFRWKMVTSWPENFPGLGTTAQRFADTVARLSNGRLSIQVFAAGALVPALEVFDAVSSGTAELGHSAAYYWKGKSAAAPFFTAVPFGMNAQEMNAWLYHGGGQELWDEIYSNHNLKPFAVGNTGTQMAGWFKKEINSLDDMQGLKLRLPGLAGEAMNGIGVSTVNMAGSEIFTSLQTGALDAADWVGPYNDLAFGLHQVADYYYTSVWNEPSAVLEGTINLDAWNALPEDLQDVIREAARASNLAMISELAYRNAQALETLVEEHGVQLRTFPEDVMAALYESSKEAIQRQVDSDEESRRVYESYSAFQKVVRPFSDAGEYAYLKSRDNVGA